MSRRWEVLSSRVIFTGRPHRLRLDTCRTPSGVEVRDYFVREVADVAMVLAVTPGGEVVLVRQYRHAAGDETLELPQGLLERGEDAVVGGARELMEETGYEAPRLEPVAELLANPAVQTNRVHLLLGRDALPVAEAAPEPEEDIEVLLVPLAELRGLIERAEIRAATSVAGILIGLGRLGLGPR